MCACVHTHNHTYTYVHIERYRTYRHVYRQIDEWIEGWKDGTMDGWMERYTQRHTHTHKRAERERERQRYVPVYAPKCGIVTLPCAGVYAIACICKPVRIRLQFTRQPTPASANTYNAPVRLSKLQQALVSRYWHRGLGKLSSELVDECTSAPHLDTRIECSSVKTEISTHALQPKALSPTERKTFLHGRAVCGSGVLGMNSESVARSFYAGDPRV